MSDPNEIKKQTELKSQNVTPREAAARIENVKEQESGGAPQGQMSKEDQMKWSRLVVQTWTDENFKQRLLQNPTPVLREFGINLPPGVEIRFVENTDKVQYVTLPARPNADITELDERQLAGVAGGFCCCTVYCVTPKYGDWAPKYGDWAVFTA